jgi:hypothetical protein
MVKITSNPGCVILQVDALCEQSAATGLVEEGMCRI